MAPEKRHGPPCITLYTAADCDLCHVAKSTLVAVQGELGFVLDEIDIATVPTLYEAFRAEIPVGYLDGRKIFKYRVDVALLRRQLRRRGWPIRRWLFSR